MNAPTDTESASVAPRRYRAFISYRHQDNEAPGRRWASWLRQKLEQYELPEDLVGKRTPSGEIVPRSLYPIYRDEDEMPAGHDLSAGLQRVLENSDWLIVVCSPRTVASRWVNAEIRHFKERGRADRILAFIVDGEPLASTPGRELPLGVTPEDECFPESLRFGAQNATGKLDWALPAEQPCAADVRPQKRPQPGFTSAAAYRDSLRKEGSLSEAQIEEEVQVYEQRLQSAHLQLIAGVLGLALGELTRRDKAEQLRRATLRARQLRRWLVIVSGLALLVALGAAIAWWQWSVADERRRQVAHTRGSAERLINDMLFDLRTKLEVQGDTGLLDGVTTSARGYFDGLPAALRDLDTEKNAARALAVRTEVLLLNDDAAFGETAANAFAELERLIKVDPNDQELRRRYIELRLTVGSMLRIDEQHRAQADASLDAAVAEATRMAEKWPSEHSVEFLRLKTRMMKAAMEMMGQGLQVSMLAILGAKETTEPGDFAKFADSYRRVREQLEPLQADLTRLSLTHGHRSEYREALADCCVFIGNAWCLERRPREGLRYLVAARRMYTDLREDFPEIEPRRRAAMLAAAATQIGHAYAQRGDKIRAARQFADCIQFFERALVRHEGVKEAMLERQFLDTLIFAAATAQQNLSPDSARAYLGKARDVAVRILRRNPGDDNARLRFTQCVFLDAMNGNRWEKKGAASMVMELEVASGLIDELLRDGVAMEEAKKMKAETEKTIAELRNVYLPNLPDESTPVDKRVKKKTP